MGRSGFSIVELMIAIIIAGVIAALGFPKIHTALDKTNVRAARVDVATFTAIARSAAVQRGCRAVIHFVSGSSASLWVTVCPRYAPGAGTVDTLAAIDNLVTRYNVMMTSTRDSVQFDPRGLSMDGYSSPTIVRFTGNVDSNTDSVTINVIGKVVR